MIDIKEKNRQRDEAIKAEFRKSTVMSKTDEAHNALNDSVLAMQKLARLMAETNYEDMDYCPECKRKGMAPEQAGKTLAYVAKMVNEITRLLQFAKGEADSRTEVVGLADLLRALPDDKAATVREWFAGVSSGQTLQ